jgi:GntR family transcriptional regulator
VFFEITTQNGVPVYDQIARQVKFAVADGALAPGDLIPSVRELAKELAVNPNTVARAYRQLQAEEIVEAIPGTGLAVRTGARRVCNTERRGLMKERMRLALAEAVTAGLELAEIKSLVESELARLAKE